MKLRFFFSGTLAVFCLMVSATAATTVISDTDFLLSDWSATAIFTGNGGSHTVSQSLTGGNPGAYRFMTHTMNAGVAHVDVFHEFLGASYDPSVQGGFGALDYQEDQIQFNPPFVGAAIGARPALIQGGETFLGPVINYTDLTWQTVQLSGLTANDFTGMTSGQNPDFSSSGGVIGFGYFRRNSQGPGGTGRTNEHGIDNWSVTIIPEPSRALLSLIGLGAVLMRRRPRPRRRN